MDERQKPVAGVEVARTVIQEESKEDKELRRSKRVEMQRLLAASVKKQKKSDNNCSTSDCMWCELGVFEEKTGFSGQLKAAKVDPKFLRRIEPGRETVASVQSQVPRKLHEKANPSKRRDNTLGSE